MNPRAWLALAASRGVDRQEARDLLQAVTGRSRAWQIAHEDEALDTTDAAALQALLQRRAAGEPLAYLTGGCGFHGLTLQVTPAVLVPRPDTETLVDWALDLLGGCTGSGPAGPPAWVADLGTGSGAIALAVARACPHVRVVASDLSAEALQVAQTNARQLGLIVDWLQGSWWEPYDEAAVPLLALALSNPPYLGAADPHLPALRHEPTLALVPSGGEALGSLRAVVAGAPRHLAPGAWLLLEHGHDQAEAVARLLGAVGFDEVSHRQDLAGHWRCTGGRWPGPR